MLPRGPLSAALPLLALLLAGCQGPAGGEDADPGTQPAPSALPVLTTYELRVVTVQEATDGAPLHAQVEATVLGPDGALGTPQLRHADADGVSRFTFFEPVTVLVDAQGPEGWTREGAKVTVGDTITAPGFTASDRDLFVPLYRDVLTFQSSGTWANVVPAGGPEAEPALLLVPLALPDGAAAAYLARLSRAEVTVRWEDAATSRASIAAGLAADGTLLGEGPESGPEPLPGERTATWDGEPAGPLAADAVLQAAAVTRTAVVGEVLLGIEATLIFGGVRPPELPEPVCHATLCPGLPPLPPEPVDAARAA